jgi:hypothetical protein
MRFRRATWERVPVSINEISLRCKCGKVQGTLSSPQSSNRVICYCDDCQAFVRFLGRTDIMDAHGGTDIVQVTQAQVKLPREELRSMRLSEKGPLRWYTDCCKTPAGNMLPSYRSPFVGIASGLLVPGEGRTLDEVVGPAKGAIYGRFAIGGCPPHAHPTAPLGLIVRSVGFFFKNALLGRHKPSPFFDAHTHAPVSPPKVLTPAERKALQLVT